LKPYRVIENNTDLDRRSLFDFYRLKEIIELRITATENAERMAILPYGNMQDI